MSRKPKYNLLLTTLTFLPMQLSAIESIDNALTDDKFYIGTSLGVGYIPSDNFKLVSWKKVFTEQPPNTDGLVDLSNKSIKNKSTYNFTGTATIGCVMSDDLQFDIEVGLTMSPKIKVQNTTISPATGSKESINGNEMTKTNAFYALANGYFNIDIGKSFTPYMGAGVGIGHYKITFSNNAFNKNFYVEEQNIAKTGASGKLLPSFIKPHKLKDVVNEDASKNGIILQGSFGVNIMLTDKIMTGVGYRFLGSTGALEFETESNSNTNKESNKVKYYYKRHMGIASVKFLM